MFTVRYELNVHCLCTRRFQHKMAILFGACCVHYLWEQSCWGRADILYLVKLRTNIYLGFTLTDTWRMGRHCLQDINHNIHTEYGTLKMWFWFSSCLRKWCEGHCAVRTGGWRGRVLSSMCSSWFGKIRHVGYHFLYIYLNVFLIARKFSEVLPEICVGRLKITYYFVQLNS